MKISNLSAVILFGIILLQIGCFKDKIDGEKLLSNEMKNQNPYQENNKLYFESDSAKEYIFQVSSRTIEFLEYQHGNYAPNYLIELEKTIIYSLDTSQQYSFRLEMGSAFGPKLNILFYPIVENGMSAYFDLPLSNASPQYVDSVYVNEKWHYGVYVVEKPKEESSAYKLYYSTELGIIKIDFSDDSTWELMKIE